MIRVRGLSAEFFRCVETVLKGKHICKSLLFNYPTLSRMTYIYGTVLECSFVVSQCHDLTAVCLSHHTHGALSSSLIESCVH